MVQGGVIAGYCPLGHAMGVWRQGGVYFLFSLHDLSPPCCRFPLAGPCIREAVFVALSTMAGAGMEEALGLSLMWFFRDRHRERFRRVRILKGLADETEPRPARLIKIKEVFGQWTANFWRYCVPEGKNDVKLNFQATARQCKRVR